MSGTKTFDDWPEKYEQWFTTPIGRLIRKFEGELILDMLQPSSRDRILDAGCGTGIFTVDLVQAGAAVTGLDLSFPMIRRAGEKFRALQFQPVLADIRNLPFKNSVFDKTVSVTALEFVKDARAGMDELFRVTRSGGTIVAATLNRLSPWAERRTEAGKKGHTIFKTVYFRSPDELLSLAPVSGRTQTAIHFHKDDEPGRATALEKKGRAAALDTGAFVAAVWEKP
jgi:ubiquinone/menaquinone biosynthesis C-methylase UbiE